MALSIVKRSFGFEQIWSNIPMERLNKETRRRTNVLGIFPDRPAFIRLVGAVLVEQHDEWALSSCYLNMSVTDVPGPGIEGLVVLPRAAD